MICFMVDMYGIALKKLRADRRSINEMERAIGIPAETLRDIKRGIVRHPRYDTLQKIARHYTVSAP